MDLVLYICCHIHLMKKAKSRVHWLQLVIPPYVILGGIGVMILGLKMSIENPAEKLSMGAWLLVGSFASFGIFFLLWPIRYYKVLIITEEYLIIRYPLVGKELKYHNHEIIKWYEHINIGSYGHHYKTFHFQTNDNKIFMFSDYEFRNYQELILLIISKSKNEYINKLHNLKKFFILFTISSTITFLIIYITLKIALK